MFHFRPAAERGGFDFGTLLTRHSFSFGDYYDPKWMSFRPLRVMNEDVLAAGGGFPMHPHKDMEIVTFVLAGALSHKDSLGNGSTIRAGGVQRMTAGTGIVHSEFNDSKKEPVHLYQVWILPDEKNLVPGYEERLSMEPEAGAIWRLAASKDGRDGSVVIHQDAAISIGRAGRGQRIERSIPAGRHVWLQVVGGTIRIGGRELDAGGGVGLSDETSFAFEATDDAHLLLFDLA